MISLQLFIGVLVTLLIGSGMVYYLWQILYGTVVPHRMTYFFWFIAQLIAFTASMVQGVSLASQTTVILTGVGCFLILIASFYQKDKIVWQFSKFDWWCATISVVGILLWQITNIPNLALIFAIIADFVITLPTLVKSYKAPQTESAISYVPSLFAHVLALAFLTKEYNFQTIAMPIYLFMSIVLIISFILAGRYKKSLNMIV